MSEAKKRRSKVEALHGAQPLLALDQPEVTVRTLGPATRLAAVMFEDADPRDLWVGRAPLADHLRATGMGWVLAVREFMRHRDWSKFEAAYVGGGRPPHHPVVMMSLALFGTMFGQSSLRDLETLARVDVRVWWLTGGAMPDHSAIGRFLNRHAELITTEFFEDLTKAVVRLLGSSRHVAAIDATVIQAAASRLRTIKQEAARQAAADAKTKAEAAPDDAKLAAAAELAALVAKTAEERSAERKRKGDRNPDAPVSPLEPEAVLQPMKSGQMAPSYQACIAADENRVILAHRLEGSSEPAAVPHLLDQAERVTGAPIETMLGDGRYNTGEIHQLAQRKGFELLAPAGPTSSKRNDEGQEAKFFGKSSFTFDRQADRYTCPAGEQLSRLHRSVDRHGRSYVQYQTQSCTSCPLQAQCIRGKGCRTINRYDSEQAKEDLAAKMQQPEVKRRYAKRQVMVEPIFSETKGIQKYVRFRRRRRKGAAMEHSLQCCAHNLRRALRVRLPSTGRGAPGQVRTGAAGSGRTCSTARIPSPGRLSRPLGRLSAPGVARATRHHLPASAWRWAGIHQTTVPR